MEIIRIEIEQRPAGMLTTRVVDHNPLLYPEECIYMRTEVRMALAEIGQHLRQGIHERVREARVGYPHRQAR
jgi:hypothetical protein